MIEYDLAAITALLNEGFTGYVIPMNFLLPNVARSLPRDSIDSQLSRVIVRDGQPVGIALIARRGWTSRLAAFGMAPAGRGQGIGQWAMRQLIAEAHQRGDRTMVLEVIEQNAPAVRLYHNVGFQTRRRLIGMVAHQPASDTAASLSQEAAARPQEVDIRDVARIVTQYGLPDLPWQLSGETLALLTPPAGGYRLGSAFAIIGDTTLPRIDIRSLVVLPDARRQGHGTALLRGLFALFPNKTWAIPVLMPEELAFPALEQLGFVREDISQLQMEQQLSS